MGASTLAGSFVDAGQTTFPEPSPVDTEPIFLDTFTGVDGTTVNSRPADTGETYSTLTGYTGGADIIDNALQPLTGQEGVLFAFKVSKALDVDSADFSWRLTIGSTALANHTSIMVRVPDNSADTGLTVRHNNGNWEFIKRVAGVQTTLSTTARTYAAGTVIDCLLECHNIAGTHRYIFKITPVATGVQEQIFSVDNNDLAASTNRNYAIRGVRSVGVTAHIIDTLMVTARTAEAASPNTWNGDSFAVITQSGYQFGGEGPLPPYQYSSAHNVFASPQNRTHSNTNAAIHGATLVNDPIGLTDSLLGGTRKAVALRNVETTHGFGSGASSYSRMDMRGYGSINNGDFLWVISEILFPTGFPTMNSGMPFWAIRADLTGAPFNGSSTSSLSLTRNQNGTGNDVVWKTGSDLTAAYILCRIPIILNRWLVIARKIKVSNDPNIGYSELYAGTRNADGSMPGAMAIVPLLPTTGVTLAVGTTGVANTRRKYNTYGVRADGGGQITDPNAPALAELKNRHSIGYLSSTTTTIYFARYRIYDANVATALSAVDPFSTGLR